MSSDATDPVKALREFAALPPKWPGILDDRLASIMRDLSAFARTCTAVDDGFARELDAFGKARALLAAAPALLARIEAGEAKLAALESRLAESERSWALRLADAESRLAERDAEVAVLARNHVVLIDEVAEQAPVVEAAERQADIAARLRPIDIAEDEKWLAATATTENAVTAMLAARSLRGAGEGGGA